ncbi:copper homeostasis protein CutC [Nakamurella aerolata]|uniref:copper homeostasis protein CutC n=1 Tax=Nakamurella aerolata TaxID=1656892 RepID=UPI001BB1E9FF
MPGTGPVAAAVPGTDPVQTEVCVDSVAGVRVAAAAGADRVELCSALEVGGLTPSLGLIEAAVDAAVEVRPTGLAPMAVHVLIRCRPGDFCYAPDELALMARDAGAAVSAGADGLVLGALTRAGSVDAPALLRLAEQCRIGSRAGLVTSGNSVESGGRDAPAVTFHRAIDVSADPVAALWDIAALADAGLRVQRVLSSGQARSAAAGVPVLAAMVRAAEQLPLAVMAGAGIRPENVAGVIAGSGVRQVHFSARGRAAALAPPAGSRASMGEQDSQGYGITDPDAVAATITAARAG